MLIADLCTSDLVDVVVAAERLVAWAQSLSLRVVAELDLRYDPPPPPVPAEGPAEELWSHPQAPTPVQRLASELGCALRRADGTTHAMVVLTRRLHRRLPEVSDALSDGRVDLPRARAFAEETAHLDEDTAAEVVFGLLPDAPELTVGQLRNRLRVAALSSDPERTRERRECNRRTGRDVYLLPDKTGLACVSAVLGEAEAAEVFGLVQQAARTLVASDRAAGLAPRPIAQARADAFVALFGRTSAPPADQGGGDQRAGDPRAGDQRAGDQRAGSQPAGDQGAETAPARGRGPTTRIGVLVPIEALLAGLTGPDDAYFAGFATGPGASAGGPPGAPSSGSSFCAGQPGDAYLPPPAWHLAGLDRPMAGDITGLGPVSGEDAAETALLALEKSLRGLAGGRVGVQFIAVDHRGRAVAVTGTTYTVPPLLKAAVIARDRTCRFPGCTRPAVGCDLDHTRPHPHGGTELGNLAAACRRHHRLKTHAGWQVTQQPDGTLAWTSPLGRSYRTHPGTFADAVDPPWDTDAVGLALPVPPDPAESWTDAEYQAWVDELCARAEELLGPDRDPEPGTDGLRQLPEVTGPDLVPQWWAEHLTDWAG